MKYVLIARRKSISELVGTYDDLEEAEKAKSLHRFKYKDLEIQEWEIGEDDDD